MYTKEFSAEEKKEMRDALKVSDDHLKVAEIFSTIQGEGPNTGIPVIFIRLQLCNLHCIWCDSLLEGTKVLTDTRGWVPIEQVRTGEMIVGISKEANHVLQSRWIYTRAEARHKVSHVERDVIKIETDDGNELMTTCNHRIFVYRKNTYDDNKSWQWVIAEDIQTTDILWSVNSGGHPITYDTHPSEVLQESEEYIDGWIAGYDLGDGGFSNSAKKTRRYESVSIEIADRTERFLKSKGIKVHRRMRQIKTGDIHQIDSAFIPEGFGGSPDNDTLEWSRGFVAGYYDAEGSNNASLPEFSAKGTWCLNLCRTYLKKFQFNSKIVKDATGHRLRVYGGVLERFRFDAIFQYAKRHRDIWLWNTPGRRGALPFSSARQAKNKVSVISVTKLSGSYKFYDIGSSCGNFIANNLVVHNTPYTWNWEGTDFNHATKDYEQTKYDPRQEIIIMSPQEIVDKVKELAGKGIERIVWTGGEPLVQQRSKAFVLTLALLYGEGFKIEIETNGTLKPSEKIRPYIDQYNVSPKLENSDNTIKERRRTKPYEFYTSQPNAYFKFVVTGEADMVEIEELRELFNIPASKILLMPEGRTEEEVKSRAQELVKICIEKGYRFCNRLQVWVWDGALRGV